MLGGGVRGLTVLVVAAVLPVVVVGADAVHLSSSLSQGSGCS